jgi:serine protease Do
MRPSIRATAAVPLLNLNGSGRGVNAAIATESGGFEGIGFAIPSNMAVHVARALIDHGKVIRGWLGVSIRDLTPQTSQIHETQGQKGSPDCRCGPEGPADIAGLKKEDLVVKFQETKH